MKILFVSMRGPTNEDRRGGAQDYIQFISEPWIGQGHEVTILCGQEYLNKCLLPVNENVAGIDIIRTGTPSKRIRPLLDKVREIAGNFDVVIENIMGFPVFLPLILSKDKPLFAIKHHFEGKSFIKSQGWIKGLIGLALEEIFQPLFYRNIPFVVVSTKTLDEINSLWIKPRAEIRIIPPGIAPMQIDADAEKYPDPTVVYYGALDTGRKKVDHLIQAFKEVLKAVPNAKLIIGGQGPDSELLKDMAKGLPVTFKGFLTEQDKCELLERGWIFATPSMTEGFGITWVEANSAGLPVVGYDLGLDTVNDACSMMVPVGDREQLADAIKTLLSDEELIQSMSIAARKNAQRFDWELSNQKLTDFLNVALVCSMQKQEQNE